MSGLHVPRGVVAALLALPWLAAPASGAAPADKRAGWAELSRVEPGTAIVLILTDGRRLERLMVGTTADALNTVDLTLVAPGDRRKQILDLVRKFPQRYATPVLVEQDGGRILITQSFDRATIATVSKPKSFAFKLPTPVDWLLHYAGPCPNCDTTQTALSGQTPLPSPLPGKADTDPYLGEVLYRAPALAATNALDNVTWEQFRLFLPLSLRGK
jgi:hypothetical protein